jgi:putative ABC transport system permease protein
MKRMSPHRWAVKILGLLCPSGKAGVLGDAEEEYRLIRMEKGRLPADLWYLFQIIKPIPFFTQFTITWSFNMYKNYFKVAIRNLLKNKFYSLINICGLAVGVAIFLFISVYTRHELSFNKFHKNHKDIYEIQIGDELSTSAPLASAIQAQIPDVKALARIDQSYGGGRSPLLVTGSNDSLRRTKVKDFLFVDGNFFDFFSFNLLFGDASSALQEPYSMILTESLARRLYDQVDVVGRHIHYVGDRSNMPEMDMTVTAVIEDPPGNSDIQFTGLVSLATLYTYNPNGAPLDEDWNNWGYRTFTMLDATQIPAFENKLKTLWTEAAKAYWPEYKVPSIGLVSLAETPFYNNNRRRFIMLMQLISLFVLAIALINFINLTLARAANRAKEVGIRKVVGSTRMELIRQFLSEALVMSLIVTPLAFILVELGKPLFFGMIQKEIALNWIRQPGLILIFATGIFAVGMAAGIYPAVVMASFKASTILKGELSRGKKRNALRSILVVTQFSISTALIFCTVMISNQIQFLKSKPLGFDQQDIIHCKQSRQIDEKYEVFKNTLLQNPNIISMTRSNTALGEELNIGASLELNGVRHSYRATTVDPDFIPTMNIELLEGRNFSWDIKSDLYGAMIVNETFVKTFNLKNPLGQEIKNFLGRVNPVIIGVMKDFHNDSFREPIAPSALWYANWNSTINIRINRGNIAGSLKSITQVWNELSPESPFEYQFLDETYGKLYQAETVLQRIITSFASMAVFIACLGLLGLVSYSAQQRTKEIGIRKVLGASTQGLIGLVTREYLVWVLIANAVALPLAAWTMLGWLKNFAYRTPMTAAPFLWAGCSAFLIAVLTVSRQAVKTASADPVKALKYE